ncbi:MAG: hypothetical protein SFX19_04595 [Alphaproteobacteria bacterium]|nr:hypothetical protein [Alphaproteobacteria bacterium]
MAGGSPEEVALRTRRAALETIGTVTAATLLGGLAMGTVEARRPREKQNMTLAALAGGVTTGGATGVILYLEDPNFPGSPTITGKDAEDILKNTKVTTYDVARMAAAALEEYLKRQEKGVFSRA